MDADSLYFKHRELMTEEELFDMDYQPGSSPLPDEPSWFLDRIRHHPLARPEAEFRREFEKRSPALGFNQENLDSILQYVNTLGVLPHQIRKFFEFVREMMLNQLIPCDNCKDIPDLVAILQAELSSGIPAPVPSWYKYSTVTMGPRRIGYWHCHNRGCYRTENCENKFSMCANCELPSYCSRECQRADWKARHKVVCKEGKLTREKTKSVGKMLQMLSDMSLTGGLPEGGINDMFRAAYTDPGVMDKVKERRQMLKDEKNRPK